MNNIRKQILFYLQKIKLLGKKIYNIKIHRKNKNPKINSILFIKKLRRIARWEQILVFVKYCNNIFGN